MKDSSIVGHVREALECFIEEVQVPPDEHLRKFYAERRYLGSRDRRAISRDYYLAIRFYWTYLRKISTLPNEPSSFDPGAARNILALLLDEQSDYRLEDILLGCNLQHLPTIDRPGDHITLDVADQLADRYGFSRWMSGALLGAFGSVGEELMQALNEEAETHLRIRRPNLTLDEVRDVMAGIGSSEVLSSEWTPDAVVLTSRMNLRAVPLVRNGDLIVQSVPSQLVSLLLQPLPGESVLDACAGAGGKSIHLHDLTGGEGRIVAHDLHDDRLERLKKRAAALGLGAIVLLPHQELMARWSEHVGMFDAVLIDAPCSGTGTLQRNPGLKLTVTEEIVEQVIETQFALLLQYAELVRVGGRMVYATCSLLPAENEDQIDRFLEKNSGWRVKSPAGSHRIPSALISPEGYFQCNPVEHGVDGFFGALLERCV